jgi:hypothetical protein
MKTQNGINIYAFFFCISGKLDNNFVNSIYCTSEGSTSSVNDADRCVIIRKFLDYIFSTLPLFLLWWEAQGVFLRKFPYSEYFV